MKRYRFVKEEGAQREVLGETMIEHEIAGKQMLVLRAQGWTLEELDAFRECWTAEMKDAEYQPLIILADCDVDIMRLEEVEP